ncbi:MAG: N-6 DNA methylase [Bacteroidales bacterium]|nr:N-6 DNA methylase [Bacteroidales bacterium]
MDTEEALKQIFETFEPNVLIDFFRAIGVSTLTPLIRSYKIEVDPSHFCTPDLLGVIKLGNEDELAVFTVKVVRSLTERSGKKAQYELAKKILKAENRYPAGIFIFHDDKNDFRFSLVYNIPLATGKRDWSNFRRYTYFISKEQTNKTFIHQITQADFSSVEKLTEAFSVEKVTKDFYSELQNWYFWAMNIVEFPDDEDKDKNSRNAKNLIRLITRIIFIWFMKEKRLISANLFDKSYVDTLLNYDDATGSTYYKSILQNLFFATLNTPMRKDNPRSRIFIDDAKKFGFVNDGYLQQGYYRYSRFITDKEAFLKEFDNIPFLNGGLFECLDKKIDGKEVRIDCFSDNPKNETRLKVPDEIFFSEEEVEANLSAFLGSSNNRRVRGLIPILKSYNFTTDENTPIDEEIALDPELLGKVFENLLASYNPETAVTARKATGSYYTPREIVDYMVTESLVMNLAGTLGDEPATIEKLKKLFSYSDDSNPFDAEETESIISSIEKIRILDPACGSGAFPMGILHKLVLALHKLDPQNLKWKKSLIEKLPLELRNEVEKSLENKSLDYIRKLGLIEHCIFGVDIQEIAIQISKLRFFISLLIEQEVDDNKPNRDIRALPNLETKFVAANSLIGLETDSTKNGYTIKTSEVKALEEKLFAIREKIFYTNSRSEKLQLERELTLIREQLKLKLEKDSFSIDKSEKITSWDPFDQNTHAEWFDPEWMFGVKTGFDIVIGNPPYGIKFSENEKEYFKKHYLSTKTISGKQKGSVDSFSLFIEKGFNILKKNGNLIYIVPISITSSDSMTALHNLLEKNCTLIKISSYAVRPQPIFQNAVINTSILFFIKTLTPVEQILCTKMYRKGRGFDLKTLLENLQFIDVKNYKLHGRYPKISFPIETRILDKLFSIKTKTKDLQKNDGKTLYYRTTGGRYFKVITNYSTGSTKEKGMLIDKHFCDAIGAILSSNLFFWYYQIYSNNLDLKSYEIESFPIPVNELTEERIKVIEMLYGDYLKDIEKNAKIRTTKKYANIDTFKEYKIGKSKKYIDVIDDFIGPLYGLNKEEIEFIKNYEIEFRLTENEED